MYVRMHVCTHMRTRARAHTHTHTPTHTYICMYVCMYIYIYIHTHIEASKYSQNHFISEKQKTAQQCKLYFPQNNPLIATKHLPATVKVSETFMEAFCESIFSSSVAFLMMSEASQKRHAFNDDFSQGNR